MLRQEQVVLAVQKGDSDNAERWIRRFRKVVLAMQKGGVEDARQVLLMTYTRGFDVGVVCC